MGDEPSPLVFAGDSHYFHESGLGVLTGNEKYYVLVFLRVRRSVEPPAVAVG
jgi:hypothetical protein